jgi:hypothetical protein
MKYVSVAQSRSDEKAPHTKPRKRTNPQPKKSADEPVEHINPDGGSSASQSEED